MEAIEFQIATVDCGDKAALDAAIATRAAAQARIPVLEGRVAEAEAALESAKEADFNALREAVSKETAPLQAEVEAGDLGIEGLICDFYAKLDEKVTAQHARVDRITEINRPLGSRACSSAGLASPWVKPEMRGSTPSSCVWRMKLVSAIAARLAEKRGKGGDGCASRPLRGR